MKCLEKDRNAPQDDHGFTLVELLVVMTILTIIGGLVVGTVVNAFEQERRTTSRVHAMNDAKLALERITADVRAADPLHTTEETLLEATVHRGEERLVSYELGTNNGDPALIVSEDVDGTVTTRPLVTGLASDGLVFEYVDGENEEVSEPSDVRRVQISVTVEVGPDDAPITLSDDTTIRNVRLQDAGS